MTHAAPVRPALEPDSLRLPSRARGASCALSLVVPAFDEEPNIAPLHARIVSVFGTRQDWELVLVDDGSRDGTRAAIRTLAQHDARVVGVGLARHQGQSAALAGGVRAATGGVIATLDADLQNDPADLPRLLGSLAGHDAVVGYRRHRRDGFVRRASSRLANRVRNFVSCDEIRDTGCGLKVFRAECLRAIPWFDGVHRFLPTLLRYQGFRVLELPVSHHARRAGRSKYGIANRAWRAGLDLLAVRWMRERALRPCEPELLLARKAEVPEPEPALRGLRLLG